jgi:hypothetical protein
MLGERYMYKHRVSTGRDKGKYKPLYIDMTTPVKFTGSPLKNATIAAAKALDEAASTGNDERPEATLAEGSGDGGEGHGGSRRKTQPEPEDGAAAEVRRRRRHMRRAA